jgi:putative transposase
MYRSLRPTGLVGDRYWLGRVGAGTPSITPGSPWENGSCEPFNGTLRDEPLNRELFTTRSEAKVLVERWRVHDDRQRPHSVLGHRPPAPETIMPTPPTERHAMLVPTG